MEPQNIIEAMAKVIVGNVHISIDRYNELLKAEQEAEQLKSYIAHKAEGLYDSISPSEIEVIAKLFGVYPEEPDESEGAENG